MGHNARVTAPPQYQPRTPLAPVQFLLSIQDTLAAGEKGRVKFQYMRHPEFLQVGSRILFREGRTKGIGEVIKLVPYQETNEEKKYSPNKRKPSREIE